MRTTEQTGAPPHWDMTPYYPGLASPEFERDLTALLERIVALEAMVDGLPQDGDGASVAGPFDRVTEAANDVQDLFERIEAYVYAFVATDTRDDLAQARLSELDEPRMRLAKLDTRFDAWIGTADLDALTAASSVARDHAFAIRRRRIAAHHQMSPAEEDLAAELSVPSSGAWSRLHSNVSSRLSVEMRWEDAEATSLPMSALRGLSRDPDETVRRRAYEAELRAWEEAAVPLAAALNSIKGTRIVLDARRGWAGPLDAALFANNVDRATLEAMQTACVESFPDFRRYLRAKARAIGKQRLAWWDLFAPVASGGSVRRWPFEEATAYIVDRFGAFSDRLASLAQRAFSERWVDAAPRLGKVDGAFCMPVRDGESRVLMNYEPSFTSVSTLAHELGHAYHNVNLASRTALQRQTPMTLAETASIFCQTIVLNAMLNDATGEERLSILESELQGTCQIVVDIHSRFLFETAVFDGRGGRELSVAELNEAMLGAQRATYGDGLDPETLHPYMWAAKPHYYGLSYYNWPYTFGALFGLGLYAEYKRAPEDFRAGYDEMLSSTGLADAATLAASFGIDIRSEAFWRSSLDVVRARIEAFEQLA